MNDQRIAEEYGVSEPHNGLNGHTAPPDHRVDPKAAAQAFAGDPAWRAEFEAAKESIRQELELKRRALNTELDEQLAALGGTKPISFVTRIEDVPMQPAGIRAVPKVLTGMAAANAIRLLKEAGKDGLAARSLGKALGTAVGPVVRPLIEAGKVKQKGKAGATRYFAV